LGTGRTVTVVLRSGTVIEGPVVAAHLGDQALEVADWTIKLDEVVAVKGGLS
jgi:hypothetical protein